MKSALSRAIDGTIRLLRHKSTCLRGYPVDVLIEVQLESCLVFGKHLRRFEVFRNYIVGNYELSHRRYGKERINLVRPRNRMLCKFGSVAINAASMAVDDHLRQFMLDIHGRHENAEMRRASIIDAEIVCLNNDHWCRLAPIMFGPAAFVGLLLNDLFRREARIPHALQMTLRYPERVAIKCVPPLIRYGRSPVFSGFASFRPHDSTSDMVTPLEEVIEALPEAIRTADEAMAALVTDHRLNHVESAYLAGEDLSVVDDLLCSELERYAGTLDEIVSP